MASPQREAPSVQASDENSSSESEQLGVRRTAPDKREGFGKAIIQVLAATLLFGVGLYLYYGHVQTQEEIREIGFKAKDQMARNGVQDLTGAEAAFQKALALDDGHPYVLSALGLLNAQLAMDYGMDDRIAVAQKYTQRAEEADAQKQERFGARGLLMVLDGQGAEAEKMLTDVVNRGGQGPAIFSALGLSQRAQGKIEDARTSLRRASESDWRNPRHNYWIASMYFDDGSLSNANSFLKKALNSNPDHLSSLVLRSRIAIARGDQGDLIKEARETLEDVLGRPAGQLGPRLKALALVGRSELARYEHDTEKATAFADEATTLQPELADAWLAKGLALVDAKQDGAMDALQKSFDLYPYAPRNYHLAARTLLASEQPENALKVMNIWGERVAKDAPYHIAYGNLLVQKGDADAAKSQFEEALKLDATAAEAYYGVGKILMDQGKDSYGDAIDQFNKAVSARERYPEVYEAIGWIYLDQGHYADGLKQMLQAFQYYTAQNADRDKLNALREAITKKLIEKRQRPTAKAWDEESKMLVR